MKESFSNQQETQVYNLAFWICTYQKSIVTAFVADCQINPSKFRILIISFKI